MIEGMAAGNLLLSSSILFSGSTYTKEASLADILKLKFFGQRAFYTIQDKYLSPVINEFWHQEPSRSVPLANLTSQLFKNMKSRSRLYF